MSQAKTLQNSYSNFQAPDNKIGIEFHLLLLAMLTVFGLELTINQIDRNIRSLLIQLKLPIQKNFTSKLRSNISFLLSNNFILQRNSYYGISEKGKALGLQALSDFRQNAAKHAN